MTKILARLEKDIDNLYEQSVPVIAKMYSQYFKQFEAEDNKMQKRLKAGEITEMEYKAWRTTTMITGKKYDKFCRDVSNAMLEIEKKAVELSNRAMEKVFAQEYNEVGHDIAKRVRRL